MFSCSCISFPPDFQKLFQYVLPRSLMTSEVSFNLWSSNTLQCRIGTCNCTFSTLSSAYALNSGPLSLGCLSNVFSAHVASICVVLGQVNFCVCSPSFQAFQAHLLEQISYWLSPIWEEQRVFCPWHWDNASEDHEGWHVPRILSDSDNGTTFVLGLCILRLYQHVKRDGLTKFSILSHSYPRPLLPCWCLWAELNVLPPVSFYVWKHRIHWYMHRVLKHLLLVNCTVLVRSAIIYTPNSFISIHTSRTFLWLRHTKTFNDITASLLSTITFWFHSFWLSFARFLMIFIIAFATHDTRLLRVGLKQ